MLAKVIVHAPTRDAAIRRLADALRQAELAGPRTARDLLVRVLESQPFATPVAHDTQLLDGDALADLAAALVAGEPLRRAAAAAALALRAGRRATLTVGGLAPSGWRNVPAVAQAASFDVVGSRPPGPEAAAADGAPADPLAVRYRLDRGRPAGRADRRRHAARTVGLGPAEADAATDAGADGDAPRSRSSWCARPPTKSSCGSPVRHRFAVFAGVDAVWVSTSDGRSRAARAPALPRSRRRGRPPDR